MVEKIAPRGVRVTFNSLFLRFKDVELRAKEAKIVESFNSLFLRFVCEGLYLDQPGLLVFQFSLPEIPEGAGR